MGLGDAAKSDTHLQERWLAFFKAYTELHFVYGDTPTFDPFSKEPFALYGVKLGDHIYDFIRTADGQNEIHKH